MLFILATLPPSLIVPCIIIALLILSQVVFGTILIIGGIFTLKDLNKYIVHYSKQKTPEKELAEDKMINNKPWTSNAKWPMGKIGTTTDSHETEGQAQAVCRMLERDGFRGSGKILPLKTLPLKTWVDNHEK